jgi:hypothetical protein
MAPIKQILANTILLLPLRSVDNDDTPPREKNFVSRYFGWTQKHFNAPSTNAARHLDVTAGSQKSVVLASEPDS